MHLFLEIFAPIVVLGAFFWVTGRQAYRNRAARGWPTVPGTVLRTWTDGDTKGLYVSATVAYVGPDGVRREMRAVGPHAVLRQLVPGDRVTVAIKPGTASNAQVRWEG
jgi:hypothetical protein